MNDSVPTPSVPDSAVSRVLDANLNRLREALRVLEEYVRFVTPDTAAAVTLRSLRHELATIEKCCGYQHLIASRDVQTDPFAVQVHPGECSRSCLQDVLSANFKRAQEASRVIEEYAKPAGILDAVAIAKKIRFGLYQAEGSLLKGLHE